MEDSQIVELFWQRNEAALTETANKYGRYCTSIARNILGNAEDAKECVNDTYLGAWNAIPPHRPAVLSTFLGKITRRLSLKKYRDQRADKRGGGAIEAHVDELENLIPDGQSIDENLNAQELAKTLATFVGTLGDNERRVFVCRYWYFDSISDIATRFGLSQSNVKVMLKRTRDKLAAYLAKEGIYV